MGTGRYVTAGGDDLEIGTRYAARFDDCCVGGSFTATLTEVLTIVDGDDLAYPVTLVFDNSVRLDEWNGVRFVPAPEGG